MTMHHQRPPLAAPYIPGSPYDERKVRSLLGRFYAWFHDNHVDQPQFNPGHVDQFMQTQWARNLAGSTRTRYQALLHHHVRWLADGGYAKASKTELVTPSLPKPARQFIIELTSTLSPGTIHAYEVLLRQWHQWVVAENIDIQSLTRNDVVAFSCMLQGRGLAPQTRGQYLGRLRRYLFYLSEQDLLAGNPASLIRAADFPKLPRLLPRALTPQVDAELRAKLAASPDAKCRGLLLMRHTGLRVSELAALRFNCIHEDHQGHHYLKVPLGKLKEERLVPLNDEALCLIRDLRGQAPDDRAWLIENPRTNQPFAKASYHALMQSLSSDLPKDDGLAITSHRLRHSFATELLSAGLGLAAIKQLLGHRSINMTLRYVSLTPKQLRDEYLVANAKVRQQYGNVPEAPRTETPIDDTTSALAIGDIARRVKRDAEALAHDKKAQARRAVRQLNNTAILLKQLGL